MGGCCATSGQLGRQKENVIENLRICGAVPPLGHPLAVHSRVKRCGNPFRLNDVALRGGGSGLPGQPRAPAAACTAASRRPGWWRACRPRREGDAGGRETGSESVSARPSYPQTHIGAHGRIGNIDTTAEDRIRGTRDLGHGEAKRGHGWSDKRRRTTRRSRVAKAGIGVRGCGQQRACRGGRGGCKA